jgi:hypothetical protein
MESSSLPILDSSRDHAPVLDARAFEQLRLSSREIEGVRAKPFDQDIGRPVHAEIDIASSSRIVLNPFPHGPPPPGKRSISSNGSTTEFGETLRFRALCNKIVPNFLVSRLYVCLNLSFAALHTIARRVSIRAPIIHLVRALFLCAGAAPRLSSRHVPRHSASGNGQASHLSIRGGSG